MDFVTMVRSPGYIFGPLMLLTGLVALVVCLRATLRADRPAARRAVAWSLAPVGVGILGALVGLAYWGLSDMVSENRAETWGYLGYTVLFGILVAAVPLVWSVALLRRQRSAIA